MRTIDAALPAEQIGARARRPGCRVNTVHLWSIANFFLIGRKVFEMFDPSRAHDIDGAHDVLDFWERATKGFRGDGTRHAADSGAAAPYGPATIEQLLAGVHTVDDPELRRQIRSFNATLVAYLFLLYFDTRVGHGDTGPYPLPDGKVLLVRDFYALAESDFPWSSVAKDVPYRNLTAALVLDGVTIDRLTDFGTSYTTPEDFLERLVGFGLFTTDGMPPGELRAVALDEMAGIVAAVRTAQSALYRNHRRRCHGTRRSAPARTCTSRSCARSPPKPASSTSWTGPCRGTSLRRSTTWCRCWRATTRRRPTKARTTRRCRDGARCRRRGTPPWQPPRGVDVRLLGR